MATIAQTCATQENSQQVATKDTRQHKWRKRLGRTWRHSLNRRTMRSSAKIFNGIVITWNRGAEQLFGYTAQEMIGHPIAKLIPTDRHDEELDILDRIRKGKTIDHYETVRCRKDGTRLDISLTVSPIIDARGLIVGASKIARNITKRKQTDLALRASEERLRQLTSTLEERVKERTQELETSYTRLRALATELTMAEQKERRRLATQLHDYLAQLLVVIRLKTSQLLKQHHEPAVRKVLARGRSFGPRIARVHSVAGVGAHPAGPLRSWPGRCVALARGPNASPASTERRCVCQRPRTVSSGRRCGASFSLDSGIIVQRAQTRKDRCGDCRNALRE